MSFSFATGRLQCHDVSRPWLNSRRTVLPKRQLHTPRWSGCGRFFKPSRPGISPVFGALPRQFVAEVAWGQKARRQSSSGAALKYLLGPDQSKKIFTSRYKLHLPTEAELTTKLKRELRILQ